MRASRIGNERNRPESSLALESAARRGTRDDASRDTFPLYYMERAFLQLPSGYTYYTPADAYHHPGYGYGSRVSGYIPRPHPYYRSAVPYGAYSYGYRGYGRPGFDLPPYGFGNPNYSGYNDPLLPTYGPGVQEFLMFGGADFYGW